MDLNSHIQSEDVGEDSMQMDTSVYAFIKRF